MGKQGRQRRKTKRMEMYGEMLRQLQSRLDQADNIFIRMAQTVVIGMNGGRFDASARRELAELDRKYCALLADVIAGLSTVYRGRIRMFPVPERSGPIEKMERRNFQAEELARIVETLMNEAGGEPWKHGG